MCPYVWPCLSQKHKAELIKQQIFPVDFLGRQDDKSLDSGSVINSHFSPYW